MYIRVLHERVQGTKDRQCKGKPRDAMCLGHARRVISKEKKRS